MDSRFKILTEKATREHIAAEDGPPALDTVNTPSDLKFNITNCKLHDPAVTLQEKI